MTMTSNPPATIDDAGFAVRRTVTIAAPPEKAWIAITDPGAPDDEVFAHSTMFRFTLEPIPGGTSLTVAETGFDALSDPAAAMRSNRAGWTDEIDELVAYLEAG